MALPKMNIIKHTLTLPSNGKELTYRPFLVKEEKILMMAMESGEVKDIVRATRDIISSCVEDELDVPTLPMFDIEYIFLQLRAKSVGDELEVSFSLEDDPCDTLENKNCVYNTKIKVDDIQVERDKNHKDIIDLTDTIKIKMKYPKIEDSTQLAGLKGKALINKTFEMVGNSVDYIMEDEEIHYTKDYTKKEMEEFIQSLSSGQFKNIQEFFNTMPKLKKEVSGKCGYCEKKNTTVLEGMAAFFV